MVLTSWPGPGEYRDMYLRVGPSVPMIVLPSTGSSGSGFLIKHINKFYIVTNRHVVAGAEDKLTIDVFNGHHEFNPPTAYEFYDKWLGPAK